MGLVSEPVVEQLAKNARRLARADFALSISGIAGPDGGSATKPVGTVWHLPRLRQTRCGICPAERFLESGFHGYSYVHVYGRPGNGGIVDRSAKMRANIHAAISFAGKTDGVLIVPHLLISRHCSLTDGAHTI